MEERFKMPSIVSIILLIISIFLASLPIILVENSIDTIPIIPGGLVSDAVISILIPFIFMLILLFLGPIMVQILVRVHKLMKMNKYEYFIIPIEKDLSGKRILLRAIFPGLLAVNIAIYISLYGGLNPLFYYNGADPQNLPIVIEYIAVIVGIPVACIIMLPVWMLESSGLMCSRKVELYNRPITPDIESVAQFYIKMLKGYVGISTIVAYGLILYRFYTTSSEIGTILIVFIDPIVIILLVVPISLLVEMRADRTNARLGSHYEKLNIDIKPKTIKIE